MESKNYKAVRDELNAHSPSLCLAKWQQVTIHLQNGQTHSCHHPMTHKVPLEELASDPSALHNTKFKKLARKQMLDGVRPSECEYCWRIEDAHPDNLSDRTFKSAETWSHPQMEEIAKSDWNKSVNPSYLEVSFGNECNFRCAYCAPHISSALMKEYQQFGAYTGMLGFEPESLKESGLYPYSKDEKNPYVEHFWQWWPDLTKDLQIFRITGGEPLLNPNTFRFLEYLKSNPMPGLNLAINSNLGIPKATLKKFIEEIKYITQNNLVKSFQLYTSVDTHGKNAEFIRFGLNYNDFMNNVRTFLTEVPEVELIFMSTYNVFSVINYHKFLEEVTDLKKSFKDKNDHTRVLLDTPYLKEPMFLSCYVLTPDLYHHIHKDLAYLKQMALPDENNRTIYYESEVSKFERIVNWIENLKESDHRSSKRRELYIFLKEFQERKSIKFENYCPEYMDFYKTCEALDFKD